MKLSKAIVIAAIACITQVSSVSGQELSQAGFQQAANPQPQIALMQCQSCQVGGGDVAYADMQGGQAFGGEIYAGDMGGESCYGGCEPCAACPPCGGGAGGGFKDWFSSIEFGGWLQLGYHSQDSNRRFNAHADRLNLHQLWVYAEKVADGENGFDVGGRVDFAYGVDAQDTQAFGLDNGHWDTGWDNGIYGAALPQLFGEVAYGDTSVKFGHFFTMIGYEVVTAPDNFFYSHAYTMYNSEPFTHTGALATSQVSDFVTTYAGYSMGWDSGFEDNGDTVLSGLSVVLTDNLTVTWTSTWGRLNEFGPATAAERGQMHSIVADATLGELNYVLQIDRLDTNTADNSLSRDTFGVNNYLFFDLTDQIAAGVRFEWYNVVCGQAANGVYDNCDIYDLTFGANIKPKDFVIVRPEVRWDWDVDDNPFGINEVHPITGLSRSNQLTFGIDAIFTL